MKRLPQVMRGKWMCKKLLWGLIDIAMNLIICIYNALLCHLLGKFYIACSEWRKVQNSCILHTYTVAIIRYLFIKKYKQKKSLNLFHLLHCKPNSEIKQLAAKDVVNFISCTWQANLCRMIKKFLKLWYIFIYI